jgi:hypothetical protein
MLEHMNVKTLLRNVFLSCIRVDLQSQKCTYKTLRQQDMILGGFGGTISTGTAADSLLQLQRLTTALDP